MNDHYPAAEISQEKPEDKESKSALDIQNEFFAQVVPTIDRDKLREFPADNNGYYYAVLKHALSEIDADETSPIRAAMEKYIVDAFNTGDPNDSSLVYNPDLDGILMVGVDGEIATLTHADTNRLPNGQVMVREYESAVPITGARKGENLSKSEYPIPLPTTRESDQ